MWDLLGERAPEAVTGQGRVEVTRVNVLGGCRAEKDRISGFILTRQWVETDEGQDLVFWLASPQGPIRVQVSDQESVFFIARADLERVQTILGNHLRWRSAELKLKTFAAGQEVAVACYFPNQKQLNLARARLVQADIPLYESDVRPTDRYLMERFIKGSVTAEGERAVEDGFLDCLNPKLGPSDYVPNLRLISLDIETSFTENILYSIAVYSHDVQTVFMVADENESIPNVVCLPDESSVIRQFLHWCAASDPDVIIGWSVVAFDLRFIQQRCEALNIPFSLGRHHETVRWRTVSQGRDRHYALVPGRVVLDGIELLRTATYEFESFALDFVARQLLGRGKLVDDVDARATEIQNMYAHDKPALAKYNLEDCALVYDIFETTGLIEFAIQRSKLTGLDMDRPGGSVAAFDFLYLPKLHREGFVAPVVEEDRMVSSPGGFILNSKPGLYDHVMVLDFKSLYPSIIRTFHVDPLAMVCAEDDAIPGFKGGTFSRSRSILPALIEELWTARDLAKQAGQAANSQAIKIIMNSFYGVLGTPGCRFFDPRLASSITIRGHDILQKTRDLIEEAGYPVIYGDTDSVFVWLAGSAEGADVLGPRLTHYLNDWWRDSLRNDFQLESFLEVEYETYFERFLMPTVRGSEKGSKKRYAGLIRDDGQPQLVFKGLEAVRSDWSQLAKEFQQELYRRVFLEEPFEDYIRLTVEAVKAGECDEKLVLRKRLRRKLDEYEKNQPPHVRAARRAQEIRRARGLPVTSTFSRGWIEYVMTLNGPEPRLYLESPIDYGFYIDKQLTPIADAILSFKSASLGAIIDKQMGLF